jgi:hypothetical protein
MSTPRRPRPAVDLPRATANLVKELAEARGTTASALYYHWVLEAAQIARAGMGHLLPQQRRARRNSLGNDVITIHWAQGPEEYAACKALIDAAGSSVPTVLRRAGQAYVNAEGDAVAMSWPPKSVIRKLAA